jgi:hypothetical protein
MRRPAAGVAGEPPASLALPESPRCRSQYRLNLADQLLAPDRLGQDERSRLAGHDSPFTPS